MIRQSLILSLLAGSMFVFGSASPRAESQPDHHKMLNSVVFIECGVEFQGTLFQGATGSGFLVANSEYVITNNHVIDQCHSDNKIPVFKAALQYQYFLEIQNGKFPTPIAEELRQNPNLVEQLKNDSNLLERYIVDRVEKLANAAAKEGFSNIGQKLFIAYMGKEAQSPIKVDVSNIVWTSSKGDEKARETGMDIAVLKLIRPLRDRPSVTFATGNSAQVGDQVYTVGFPRASGDTVDSAKYIPTLNKGIVSKLGGQDPRVTEVAKGKGLKGVAVIETDAAISPGNSGGPLYNQYGEVLGINTFVSPDRTSGIGWAQDIAAVIPVLKDLGLPLPKIVDKPRTWIDKNLTLVSVAAGAVVLALLAGLFIWRRGQATRSPGSLGGNHPGRSNQPVAPYSAERKPAIRGVGGEYAGASIPIPRDGLMLGRTSGGEGHIMFSDNSDISRRHCTVAYSAGSHQFEITDLGSTNGTFIIPGEKRLTPNQKVACKPGQVIRLGRKNEFELVLQ